MVVPNYNREVLLPTCLESLRAQTFTDWRAVIGDNASTDRSVEIVRSFADPRFELVCRPANVGYIRNTNRLIDGIDSEFVAILHSDDWWEPDFLRQMVGLLEETPAAFMAVSAINYVVEGGTVSVKRLNTDGGIGGSTVLPSVEATRILVQTWPFLTPSDVLARCELYRRFRFEESLPYSTDWLMWLRAASVGAVAVCHRPLANNRIHPSSVTGEAERNALWADEWIRLVGILEADWHADGSPYPGAARELRAANALRFVIKSYELHERGNRAAALKLARLAQVTAPSRALRAGARGLRMFIRMTTPAAAVRFRRLAARLARRLRRPRKPGSEVQGPRSTVTDILAVLERSD